MITKSPSKPHDAHKEFMGPHQS